MSPLARSRLSSLAAIYLIIFTAIATPFIRAIVQSHFVIIP